MAKWKLTSQIINKHPITDISYSVWVNINILWFDEDNRINHDLYNQSLYKKILYMIIWRNL